MLQLLAAAAIVGRHAVSGFAIRVDAHEEQCFYEDTETGTKMGLSFQVAEGGFLDIDVVITGPDGKVVYSGERETDGKYTFSAHMDGRYKYCFSNKMSTMTPKLVVFNLNVGHKDTPHAENAEKASRLSEMVQELSEALYNVKREQEYMDVREKTHRAINTSTNSRVVYWSFFEALVLLLMTVGQVYYLNRFFEVKTTV
jgi:hypothetical protein